MDARKILTGDIDEADALQSSHKEFCNLYPTVGVMLTGMAKSGSLEAVPKSYLTIFLDGNMAVCKFNAKDSDIEIWAQVRELQTLFLHLEGALAKGDFTRRKRDARKAPY